MKRILFMILPFLCLSGCGLKERYGPEILKGDAISKELRSTIKSNNISLLKSLKNRDLSGLRNLLSDPLIESLNEHTDSIIKVYGMTIKDAKFKVLDEYYTKAKVEKQAISIKNDSRKGHEYSLDFVANQKEFYISLLVIKIDAAHSMLLTVIYSRYYTNWLVDVIRFGSYDFNGKTLRTLLKDAKQSLKDSNLVDAHINITLANSCAASASNILTYKNETVVTDFIKSLNRVVNATYHFPIKILTIASQPEIQELSFIDLPDEGCFPMVIYKTKIPISHLKDLKAENDLLQTKIGSIFKGIDQSKKYVLYRAINQMPDKTKEMEYYGFIDTLKNKLH
jgi:hypothetical protein